MDRDFGLSPEQKELLGALRRFVADRVAPAAAGLEERKEFPRELFADLGGMGLAGIPYEEKYGGGGQSFLTYLSVLEEVATGSLPLAVTLSVHHLATFALAAFGSDELKLAYLPRMTSGEWLGAYGLTEPSSGSDAAALRTRAEREAGGFRLTGTKRFITHGGEADLYLIFARTGGEGPHGISAFAVENGSPGLSFGKREDKMGWNASPTREVILEGCPVPSENLVGEEGGGFAIALAALDAGRLGVAASAVGLGQAALEAAVAFAKERRQFGRRIIEFQGLRWMLADMALQVEAARRLVREVARLRDAEGDITMGAAMSKLFATDMAMKVTTDAVQVHGGYGYMREYPVERYMREAKVLQIVEGTNQIQRLVIARALDPRT